MNISIKKYYIVFIWLAIIISITTSWLSDIYSFETKTILSFLLFISFSSLVFNNANNLKIKIFKYVVSLCFIVILLWRMISQKDFIYITDIMSIQLLLISEKILRPRYYQLSLALGLIISFSGILYKENAISYILFILYLVISSICLNALNLNQNMNNYLDRSKFLDKKYFMSILKFFPIGLVCAVLIFLFFPRLSTLNFQLPFSVKKNFRTGYTENISLADFGQININNSLVLQIASNDQKWLKENANNLYMKGSTLENFNGLSWSKSDKKILPYQKNDQIGENKVDNKKSKNLEIITKLMFNKVIFIPKNSFSLIKISANVGNIFYDPLRQTLEREGDNALRFKYQINIQPEKNKPTLTLNEVINNNDYSNKKKYHSDLSSLPLSLKNSNYFIDFKNNFQIENSIKISSLLKQIEIFFKENYTSTLINNFEGRESLKDFLTDKKYGHCEFFATAATLLLRSIGIKSRLVAGYKGGKYNELAQIVTIRESDAHAWVEYFIPEEGWYTFDPTPMIPEKDLLKGFLLLSKYGTALNYWFNKYVVDYNATTQRNIWFSAGNVYKRFPENIFESLVYILITFFSIWIIVRFKVKINTKDTLYPEYYYKFLLYIKKNGSKISKKKHQTFARFCNILLEEGIINKDVIMEFKSVIEKDLYAKKISNKDQEKNLSKLHRLMK